MSYRCRHLSTELQQVLCDRRACGGFTGHPRAGRLHLCVYRPWLQQNAQRAGPCPGPLSDHAHAQAQPLDPGSIVELVVGERADELGNTGGDGAGDGADAAMVNDR